MAEYIEREEVLELMRSVSRDIEDVPENAFPKDYAEGWEDGLETAADKVECLFAADVRPERHGHWVDYKHNTTAIQCTACEHVFESAIFGYAYCPVCGAKMDGKDNK